MPSMQIQISNKQRFKIDSPMLLRPPPLQEEEIKSQSSNQYSQNSKPQTNRSQSKNKKKENSLSMNKKQLMEREESYEYPFSKKQSPSQQNQDLNSCHNDNVSVHSANSKKSRGKRKESTLAISAKPQASPLKCNTRLIDGLEDQNQKRNKQCSQRPYEVFQLDSEEQDKKSVGSHASRKSKNSKNKKKENSLGKPSKRIGTVSADQQQSQQTIHTGAGVQKLSSNATFELSPNVDDLYEESKVQNVDLGRGSTESKKQQSFLNGDTGELNYNWAPEPKIQQPQKGEVSNSNPYQNRKVEKPSTKIKKQETACSPFEEIILRRAQDSFQQQSRGRTHENSNEKQLQNKTRQRKIENNSSTNCADTIGQNKQTSRDTDILQRQRNRGRENNFQKTQESFFEATKTMGSKTRRNKIFENEHNQASGTGFSSSNVMSSRFNINDRSVGDRSLNKSKSKLGGLLKQSRQKNMRASTGREKQDAPAELRAQNSPRDRPQQAGLDRDAQKLQRQSERASEKLIISEGVSTLYGHREKTVFGGSKLGQNHQLHRPQPIEKMSSPHHEDNEVFDLGQSQKSDLELSYSNKMASKIKDSSQGNVKGDSVHFCFEPERKKGISILSKDKKPAADGLESNKYLDRLKKKGQLNEQFLAQSNLTSSTLRESKSRILSREKDRKSVEKQSRVSHPEVFTRREDKSNKSKVEVDQNSPIKDSNGGSQDTFNKMITEESENTENDSQFVLKSVERLEIRKSNEIFAQQMTNHKDKKVPNEAERRSVSEKQEAIAKGEQQRIKKQNQKQNQELLIKERKAQQIRFQQAENERRIVEQERIEASKRGREQSQGSAVVQKAQSQMQQSDHMKSHIVMKQIRNLQQPILFEQSGPSQKTSNKRQKMPTANRTNRHKQSSLSSPRGSRIQENKESSQIILSRDNSPSEGSERSKSRSLSQKRQSKPKQTTLGIMKNHKIQVRNQSPRADESFYRQTSQVAENTEAQDPQRSVNSSRSQNRGKNLEESRLQSESSLKMESIKGSAKPGLKNDHKKPKLLDFGSEPEDEPKSKTDLNFYNPSANRSLDYNPSATGFGEMSQKSNANSIRVPSSKPPLSRKSNASSAQSKSKSKTKEGTVHVEVNMKKNGHGSRMNPHAQPKVQKPKKTLLDLADERSYEGSVRGSNSNSQCSFDSRDSFASGNSKGSRRSSSHSKKQSTLPISIKNQHSKMANSFHNPQNPSMPTLSRVESTRSEVQIFDRNSGPMNVYERVRHDSFSKKNGSREQNHSSSNASRQKQEKPVVSKDTYFIDQRGRLVKQDLVIKGKEVYGRPSDHMQSSSCNSVEKQAYDRMRRSREHYLQRSRSRSRDGSQSRASLNRRQPGMDSSSNFSASTSQHRTKPNNYQYEESDGQYPEQNRAGSIYLQEFIKPLETPTSSSKKRQDRSQQIYNKTSNGYPSRKILNEFYENNEDQSDCYRNDQNEYQEHEQERPEVVRNVTLNELFGRQQKQPSRTFNMESSTTSSRKRSMNRTEKHQYGQSSKGGFARPQNY